MLRDIDETKEGYAVKCGNFWVHSWNMRHDTDEFFYNPENPDQTDRNNPAHRHIIHNETRVELVLTQLKELAWNTSRSLAAGLAGQIGGVAIRTEKR